MIPLPARYSTVIKSFSGGMSEAYLCEDTNLSRRVLVKGLQPGMETRRIVDEIRALQEIRSPHVVQIYDIIRSTSGDLIGIVEEYLPGSDLSDADAPLEVAHALHILYQMSAGVADIHEHDRVHRDIKPINMKFDAEGCLKIFDFGLSKIDAGPAATTSISWTPGYAAPELFSMGASGKVAFTKAVDTFAFACSAFEFLTGALPPQLYEIPPKLPCVDFSTVGLGLPPQISAQLNQCLDPNPSKRPAMAEIRDELARQLLKGKHRALLTYGANVRTISEIGKGVRVADALGTLAVSYDGFRFRVTEATGELYMNNARLNTGALLPGSCVITIGPPSAGTKRGIVTVDVSHPEVTV